MIVNEQVAIDHGLKKDEYTKICELLNRTPNINELEFEGSLEMEAIANDNLGIPFAAMLVIYEAKNSVSMVHGYTRTYTTHEIEEGRIIETGEEAGLVCRDNKNIRSFVIGHNGISKQIKQMVKLWVSNSDGKTLETEFELKELSDYLPILLQLSFFCQTYCLPQHILHNL